jgi:hypothetical protein
MIGGPPGSHSTEDESVKPPAWEDKFEIPTDINPAFQQQLEESRRVLLEQARKSYEGMLSSYEEMWKLMKYSPEQMDAEREKVKAATYQLVLTTFNKLVEIARRH